MNNDLPPETVCKGSVLYVNDLRLISEISSSHTNPNPFGFTSRMCRNRLVLFANTAFKFGVQSKLESEQREREHSDSEDKKQQIRK